MSPWLTHAAVVGLLKLHRSPGYDLCMIHPDMPSQGCRGVRDPNRNLLVSGSCGSHHLHIPCGPVSLVDGWQRTESEESWVFICYLLPSQRQSAPHCVFKPPHQGPRNHVVRLLGRGRVCPGLNLQGCPENRRHLGTSPSHNRSWVCWGNLTQAYVRVMELSG